MAVNRLLAVNRQLERAWNALKTLDDGVTLPILVQKDEGSSFLRACPLCLAILLRRQDADRRAKTETELLDTMSLRRILGCRWQEYYVQ